MKPRSLSQGGGSRTPTYAARSAGRPVRPSRVALLHILIAVCGAGLLALQVVALPAAASQAASQFPELARLRIPYLVASIVALTCLEVCLVALWRIVTLTARPSSSRHDLTGAMDLVIGSLGAAVAITVGLWVHLAFVEHTGGPAQIYLPLLALIGAALLVRAVITRRRLA